MQYSMFDIKSNIIHTSVAMKSAVIPATTIVNDVTRYHKQGLG